MPSSATYSTILNPDDSTATCTSYTIDKKRTIDQSTLVEVMSQIGVSCHLTIEDKLWKPLEENIDMYKYTLVEDKWLYTLEKEPSFTKYDNPRLGEVGQMLQNALQSNMRNGDAIDLLKALVSFIESDLAHLPSGLIKHNNPSLTTNTNGDVIMVPPVEFYDMPDSPQAPDAFAISPESWEQPEELNLFATAQQLTARTHTVVPDYVVFLNKFPGLFVLNFECNKDSQKKQQRSKEEAIVQCSLQVLTQMHFQRHGFGIVLTADSWILIIMYNSEQNNDNTIEVRQYEEHFITPLTFGDEKSFNTNGFRNLVTWMYRIIEWQTRDVVQHKKNN